MAFVSVVMPAYNASETIERAINSLLQQSLSDLEIIVVDDGSNDRTKDVIGALAGQHANIIPIYLSENVGAHEARMFGIKKAAGEWVGFLDADDMADEAMYSVLVSSAKAHDADIVVCGSMMTDGDGRLKGAKVRFPTLELVREDIFQRFSRYEFGTGMLWNKLYKKNLLDNIVQLKFPWRQTLNEDLVTNVSCFCQARSVLLLPDMLHKYIRSPNSVSSEPSDARRFVETFKAFPLALSAVSEAGVTTQKAVMEMYSKQLSWLDYQVEHPECLLAYKDSLAEAEQLLIEEHCGWLAILCARRRSKHARLKSRITKLLRPFGL